MLSRPAQSQLGNITRLPTQSASFCLELVSFYVEPAAASNGSDFIDQFSLIY